MVNLTSLGDIPMNRTVGGAKLVSIASANQLSNPSERRNPIQLTLASVGNLCQELKSDNSATVGNK